MAILRADGLQLSYGSQVLLDNVSFAIEEKQKISLLGRNGTGKSSLLRVIAGIDKPDDGQLTYSKAHRIAYLPQALPERSKISVWDYVAEGVAEISQAIEAYQRLLAEGIHDSRVESLEAQINAADGWQLETRIKHTLQRLNLPSDVELAELSGGWRRRVALAKALVQQPDLLILDEPTNHLDINSILWLEEQLQAFSGALLFVSHDRRFVDNLANVLFELDRGRLTIYPDRYSQYQAMKAKALQDEATHNAEFDKKLAQEEAWIRQGIKARRTRNEGRVRALKKMREEHAQRRKQLGTSRMQVSVSGQASKIVARFEELQVGYGEPLNQPFTNIIQRGDKIGILGDNGSGKSTFIKTLLGELEPVAGKLRRSDNIQVAYFDQLREAVALDKTVADNLGEGKDFVEVDGQRRHVIGYMQDFCFTPDRARAPARLLSGGEINRLLLAKLFTKPANLFVLDEPTNDLDVETLEVLENILVEIKATVIVISHDRDFLDNCCSDLWVFYRPDGQKLHQIIDIVGGYREWQDYLSKQDQDSAKTVKKALKSAAISPEKKKSSRKLSYKEQRELDELPKMIEILEKEIDSIEQQIAAPGFYDDHQASAATLQLLHQHQQQLEELFLRWEKLEEKQNSLKNDH